jgi:hypothetical protein
MLLISKGRKKFSLCLQIHDVMATFDLSDYFYKIFWTLSLK